MPGEAWRMISEAGTLVLSTALGRERLDEAARALSEARGRVESHCLRTM
jgi:hypothetical protein